MKVEELKSWEGRGARIIDLWELGKYGTQLNQEIRGTRRTIDIYGNQQSIEKQKNLEMQGNRYKLGHV